MANINGCKLLSSFGIKLIRQTKRKSSNPVCMTSKRLTSSTSSSKEDIRKLAKKTVLLTGSSYGIGLSMARRCYQDGANVVISSRKEDNVQKALKDIRDSVKNEGSNEIHGIACHVGDESQRQRLIDFTLEKFGRIDGFISNAAVNPYLGPIENVSESILDKLYEVNYKSHLILTQKMLSQMKKIGKEAASGCGPSIIFISTMAAFVGIPNIGPYCVSKSNLLTLTKVLAQENAKHNIRVNCITPGLINTSFATALLEKPELFGHFLTSPMGRPGHPHEIDGIASFLLSDDASYVTNEIINVSGGVLTRF